MGRLLTLSGLSTPRPAAPRRELFDEDRRFRGHLLHRLSIVTPVAIAAGVFFRSRIEPLGPLIVLLAAGTLLLMGLSALLARRGRHVEAGAGCFLLAWWLIAVLCWLSTGSIRAPGVTLLLVMPVVGVALLGRRWGRVPALGALGTLLGLFGLERAGLHPPLALESTERLLTATLSAYSILAYVVYHLGVSFEGARKRAEARLVDLVRIGDTRTLAVGLTHEINNPLNVIALSSGFISRQLQMGILDPEAVQLALELQRGAVRRVASITTSIGATAASARGAPPGEVPVAALVEGALALGGDLLAAAHVRVEVEDLDPALRVRVRPAKLEQVLVRLLQNSCDAVSGSGEPWIRIRARRVGTDVEIRVSDSGPGVPEALRGKLFSPFFTTKRPGRGLGLGLVSCAAAVHESGGRIYFDPAERHTTFVVALPRA